MQFHPDFTEANKGNEEDVKLTTKIALNETFASFVTFVSFC